MKRSIVATLCLVAGCGTIRVQIPDCMITPPAVRPRVIASVSV